MTTDTKTMKDYNLASEKGLIAVKDMPDRDEFYEEKCSIFDFLSTLEKPPLRYNTMPIFFEDDQTIFNKDRALYAFNGEPHTVASGNWPKHLGEDAVASAVIVTECEERTSNNNGFRVLVLLNADDGYSGGSSCSLVDRFNGYDMPVISFMCLAQFWDEKKVDNVVRRLAKGEVKLLSYTPDERIQFTANEKRGLKNHGHLGMKPPKLGFSIVGSGRGSEMYWHRSGTCLFHDVKKNRHLLFGQDEGSYFGCELPGSVSTATEAFEMLTPDAVKDKLFQRQGEWFAVEVAVKNVPAGLDCAFMFNSDSCCHNGCCFLPLERSDSHHHSVITSDGRVGKDGKLYVHNARLEHDEHSNLTLDGWHVLYRNTAVRSVSQEGVD